MWWKNPNYRQVDPATLHLPPQTMHRPVLIAPVAFVSPPVPYHRAAPLRQFATERPEYFGSELCFRSQPLDPATLAINVALDQAAWENREASLRSELKAVSEQANRSIAETQQSLSQTVHKFQLANRFLQDTSEHSQLLQSQQAQFANDIERLETAIRDRSEKNLKLKREHQHLRVALDETRSSETELKISLHQSQSQLDSLRNDHRLQTIENRQSLTQSTQKLRLASWLLQDSGNCIQSLQSQERFYLGEIERLDLANREKSGFILRLKRDQQHYSQALETARSAESQLRVSLNTIQNRLHCVRKEHSLKSTESQQSLHQSNQRLRFARQLVQDSNEYIQSLQSQHRDHLAEIERFEQSNRHKTEWILKSQRDQQHVIQALEAARAAESQLRVSLNTVQNKLDRVQNDHDLQSIESQQSLHQSNQKLRFARQLAQDSNEYIQSLQSQHRLHLAEINRLEQTNRNKTESILDAQRDQQHLQDLLQRTQSAEIELRAALESSQNQFEKSQDDHHWQLHDLQSDWSAERQYWQTELSALSGQVGQLAAQLHESKQWKIQSCDQEKQLHDIGLQLVDALARESATRSLVEKLKREASLAWRLIEQRVVQSRRERALRCVQSFQNLAGASEETRITQPQPSNVLLPDSIATGTQTRSFQNGVQRQIENGRKFQNEVWNSMQRLIRTSVTEVDSILIHRQTETKVHPLDCTEEINRLFDEAQAELPLGVQITRRYWNWLQHQKSEFAKTFAEIRALQQELSIQYQQSEQYRLESDQFHAQVLEMTATIHRLSEEYALLDDLHRQTTHESTLERATSERRIAQQESEILRFERHVGILRELIRQGRRRARQTIEDLENTISRLQHPAFRRAA